MPWHRLVMGQHIQFDLAVEPDKNGIRPERTYRAGDVFESTVDLTQFNGPGMTPKFEKLDRTTAQEYASARKHHDDRAHESEVPPVPGAFHPTPTVAPTIEEDAAHHTDKPPEVLHTDKPPEASQSHKPLIRPGKK